MDDMIRELSNDDNLDCVYCEETAEFLVFFECTASTPLCGDHLKTLVDKSMELLNKKWDDNCKSSSS